MHQSGYDNAPHLESEVQGDSSQPGKLAEGVKLAADRYLCSEPNTDSGSYKQPVLASVQLELDPALLIVLQDILDARSKNRDVVVLTNPDLIAVVKNLVGQKNSLRLGAPSGAGVGTSDPTDGYVCRCPGGPIRGTGQTKK